MPAFHRHIAKGSAVFPENFCKIVATLGRNLVHNLVTQGARRSTALGLRRPSSHRQPRRYSWLSSAHLVLTPRMTAPHCRALQLGCQAHVEGQGFLLLVNAYLTRNRKAGSESSPLHAHVVAQNQASKLRGASA